MVILENTAKLLQQINEIGFVQDTNYTIHSHKVTQLNSTDSTNFDKAIQAGLFVNNGANEYVLALLAPENSVTSVIPIIPIAPKPIAPEPPPTPTEDVVLYSEFKKAITKTTLKNKDTNTSETPASVKNNKANKNEIFKVRTANECIEYAKTQPKMLKLFGDFWYSNEIAILFSMANVGKSIFAVQIANALSRGANHELQILDIESMAQKVIYVDFELSDLQFLKRYSNLINNSKLDTYCFNDNFIRVTPNENYIDYDKNYCDYVIKEIEKTIIATNSQIVIIDNITALRFEAAETAQIAIEIMKNLKILKSKYNLSILVLAHTPKRPFYNPIGIYDLAGSANLHNFADSIFTVGVSHKNSDTRYIKQLKTRSEKLMYGEHNVITCEILKENKFLKFRYLNTDNEQSHLNQEKFSVKQEKKQVAKDLHKEGKSYREIAEVLDISHMTVKKWIDKV